MFDSVKSRKVQIGVKLSPSGFTVAEIDLSDASRPRLLSCQLVDAADDIDRARKLEQFVKKHALKKRSCVLVMQDSDYSLIQMATPQVEEQELKSALRWSLKDQINYPTDEAIIDVFHVPVPEHREAKIYVVAAQRKAVQNGVDIVRKSGLSLSSIDIKELSLGNFIERMEGQERGVAVLHFGQQRGSISLYNSSALYLSRTIEFGLERIEALIQQAIGEDALASEIYEPIILELQRSLDFYESEFAKPAITKLIVAPRHPLLQGFCDYAASHSGFSIEFINLGQVLAESTELTDENQASCLVAIVAAMRSRSAEMAS